MVLAPTLGIRVRAVVVEMEADRTVADLHRPDSQVHEPLAHLTVTAAVAQPLVVAINVEHVPTVGRRVAPVPGRSGRREGVEQPGGPPAGSQHPQAACPRGAGRLEPLEVGDPPGENVGGFDPFARPLWQPHATARKKASRPRQRDVGFQEVMPRNAIAIGEDEIVSRGVSSGPVEDHGLAESPILVPDVADHDLGEASHPAQDQRRPLVRPVVGDENLELAVGLHRVAPEHLFEPLGRVVGRKDHGNQHALPPWRERAAPEAVLPSIFDDFIGRGHGRS